MVQRVNSIKTCNKKLPDPPPHQWQEWRGNHCTLRADKSLVSQCPDRHHRCLSCDHQDDYLYILYLCWHHLSSLAAKIWDGSDLLLTDPTQIFPLTSLPFSFALSVSSHVFAPPFLGKCFKLALVFQYLGPVWLDQAGQGPGVLLSLSGVQAIAHCKLYWAAESARHGFH